jgi:hypothetical protein
MIHKRSLRLLGCAGSTISQVRSNEQVQQGATVAMEKGKEYGTKSWGFLRGVYANVANQVETVASANGYNVDLGAPRCLAQPPGEWHSTLGVHLCRWTLLAEC